MHLRRFIATLLVGLLHVGTAEAEEIGNAQRGSEYAEKMCASCHAVRLQELESPVAEATPFKMIADKPEMTRLALKVFLQSPHPTMPDLMLSAEDADNVIAYILSLKHQDLASLR